MAGNITKRGDRRWQVRVTVGRDPRTKKSRRSIPLPESVTQALRAHRRQQLERRMKAGQQWQDLDLAFCNIDGGPMELRNVVNRHFKPALERAGLDTSLRLYDLRHTCATLLLTAGENPKVVAERLGHASIRTTLDVYSHVLPTLQKKASEVLESLVFNPR